MRQPIPCSQAEETLSKTLDSLTTSHNRVTQPLDEWITSSQDSELTRHVTALREALRDRVHANALHALPSKRLSKTISFVLHRALCVWLLPSDSAPSKAPAESIQSLLNSLREAGLGGASGQRSFAQAMNSLIENYVQSAAVKVDWVGHESVTGRLRIWMRDVFVPVAKDCLRCLTGQPDTTFFDSEIAEWEISALEKLAKQRIKYLFEYVRAWDHSTGAILDLKVSLNSPLLTRSPLTDTGIHTAYIRRQATSCKHLYPAIGSSHTACWCYHLGAIRHVH